jgi:hypothetical protein
LTKYRKHLEGRQHGSLAGRSRGYGHLLDLEAGDMHATNNVREEGHHVIVAHGHVGDNLLEGRLLGGEVLVLLAAAVEFEAEFSDLALWSAKGA